MPLLPPKNGPKRPSATIIPIDHSANSHPSSLTFDPMLTIQLISNLEADYPAWIECSLEEKIKTIYSNMVKSEIEFAARAVTSMLDQLCNQPHQLINDLTPNQFTLITEGDWSPVNPGLQLHYDLTTAEIKPVPIINTVKIFLENLGTAGTKATTAGNLPRKFVQSMINQGACDHPKFYNVANESNTLPLRSIRTVLEIAGVIENTEATFRVTNIGRQLMEPGSEGRLFLMLFLTWFREYNFTRCDKAIDFPLFQNTTGYSLYRLSTLDWGWQDKETMCRQLIPLSMTERIPDLPLDFAAGYVEARFLQPLEMFGLVAFQLEGPTENRWPFNPMAAFRKTPLFDRVIGFEFP